MIGPEAHLPVTKRHDRVTLGVMEQNRPETRSVADGHSFANGNGPPVTILPLEGWIIGDVHWWWWA